MRTDAFPLLERCCDAATSISQIGARTRNGWLHRLCTILESLSPHHVGVMALDVRTIGGAQGWQTLDAAFAGVPDNRSERTIHDEAWEGLPSDDLAGPAGQRRPRPDRFVGPRRAMASESVWKASRYHTVRSRYGMHDFARALLPFEGEDGPRALVVQFDGFDPEWAPEPDTTRCLKALSRHIVDGYRRVFIAPQRHRRELLDRLSDAQREVAPFLATEMTEGQIADALGRSPHTIHDHIKLIYKHWGVRNRVGLRELWNLRGVGEQIEEE